MKFIANWLVTAVACAVAVWLVPGLEPVGASSWEAALFFALVLAFLNATVKPVMQFLGTPITILTLGIFHLIVNALVIELASYLSRNIFHAGVAVDSLLAAVLASIVISIVSTVVGGVVGVDD